MESEERDLGYPVEWEAVVCEDRDGVGTISRRSAAAAGGVAEVLGGGGEVGLEPVVEHVLDDGVYCCGVPSVCRVLVSG